MFQGNIVADGGVALAQVVDLSRATVVMPADADGAEKAAVQMLVEETAKRTGVTWAVRTESRLSADGGCAVRILRRWSFPCRRPQPMGER